MQLRVCEWGQEHCKMLTCSSVMLCFLPGQLRGALLGGEWLVSKGGLPSSRLPYLLLLWGTDEMNSGLENW